MNTDQFNRANEIAAEIKKLANSRDKLKVIEVSGAQSITLDPYGNHPIVEISRIQDDAPEQVRILLKNSVHLMRLAYEDEIKKLEEEFEKL